MGILIIAEAGVNHNGDIAIARQLVDVAADSGADIVKFQTFNADRLVTAHAKKADYQIKNADIEESHYEMIRRLELTPEMHHELIAYCGLRNIKFFSTGFDIESVDQLVGLGQDMFKIPSGEITNLPYLRHIGGLGMPVILSTGMSTLGEIEAALDVLQKSGTALESITVLHCSTEYPASLLDVNLRAMQTIRDAFGVKIGYSDHTLGIEISLAAAALGATVIEKHFTLSRSMPGPDQNASLEPDELKALVSGIRNIEAALGDGLKRPSAGELNNKPIARKSLVASRAIRAGEIYDESNIAVKRPGSGISPMRWDEIIGRKAPRDFNTDELIEL
jgi:N,N'-diacetyllegionaminate synthase